MTKIIDTIRNYLLCKLNYHKPDLKTIQYIIATTATYKYCGQHVSTLPCGKWMML